MDKKKTLLRTAAAVGISIGTISVINTILTKRAVAGHLLYRKEQHFYQSDFGRMFYRKQGSGTPLLLIHDLNSASSGYEWEAAAEKLASEYTVYTIDLLGFGRSDKPMMTYTNFMYVCLLRSFISQVVGSSPIVITSGSSSSLALAVEQYHTHTFLKLFCVNPQSLSDAAVLPDKKDSNRKKLLELPVIGAFLYHLTHTKKQLAGKALLKDFYNPVRIPEHYVAQCGEACHLGGRNARAAYCSLSTHFVNLPVESFLKQIQIPVALIGGTMEDSISETMDAFVLCNPRVSIHLLEHTAHLPHLEKPDEFVTLLQSIL